MTSLVVLHFSPILYEILENDASFNMPFWSKLSVATCFYAHN